MARLPFRWGGEHRHFRLACLVVQAAASYGTPIRTISRTRRDSGRRGGVVRQIVRRSALCENDPPARLSFLRGHPRLSPERCSLKPPPAHLHTAASSSARTLRARRFIPVASPPLQNA